MLIRFSVENFLSFKDRQTFSMAAGRQSRHPDHVIKVGNHRILKSGFFFGANAAGKSNLIQAVSFASRIVLRGAKRVPCENKWFRIDPACREKPGVFQFDICVNDKFYSYGFALSYTKRRIESEWLYLCGDARDVCIFDRSPGEEGRENVVTDIRFEPERAQQRFSVYSEDVPPYRTLLAEITEHSPFSLSDFMPFQDVWDWFEHLLVIFPESHYSERNTLFEDPGTSSQLVELLRSFDTGIENITGREQPVEKALGFLPDEIIESVVQEISDSLEEHSEEENASIRIPIENRQFEVRKKDGVIMAKQLAMDHGNPDDLFDFSSESDGTQRLFDLIPVYQEGINSTVILIDELDRSFHSRLTIEYIRRFFQYAENSRAQLIATTHDTNVMDLDMLRQDEIWFVERGKDHSSRIFSLNKFQERYDKKVGKDYLLGRYGAIPCFQQMEDTENEGGDGQ